MSDPDEIARAARFLCRTYTREELCRCERLEPEDKPCVACRLRDLVFEEMDKEADE